MSAQLESLLRVWATFDRWNAVFGNLNFAANNHRKLKEWELALAADPQNENLLKLVSGFREYLDSTIDESKALEAEFRKLVALAETHSPKILLKLPAVPTVETHDAVNEASRRSTMVCEAMVEYFERKNGTKTKSPRHRPNEKRDKWVYGQRKKHVLWKTIFAELKLSRSKQWEVPVSIKALSLALKRYCERHDLPYP